ncbi:MAG: hypothetical protein ACXVZ1_09180, partial [Gaiellaceae bacterium]
SSSVRSIETIAGFVAAASIFLSLIALAYRPMRVATASALAALIAAGIGGRYARLARFAVAIAAVCWVVGAAIAVVTSHPPY